MINSEIAQLSVDYDFVDKLYSAAIHEPSAIADPGDLSLFQR